MKTIVFVIILFGSVPCFAQIDTVLARYKRVLMQRTIPEKTASVWLQTINTNGQWPDVDYKDTVKANWKTSLHLQHTRDLAILFNSSTSSFYHSAAVATAINASLDHWLQQRYKNSNWWHNQIGVPQLMRDIIILFRDSLTPERFKQSMEVLAQHRVNGTGANLTWSADLAFHYGALSNDTALMHRCVDLLRNEIKISDEEGVRYDYSFHQHGHRLQIYSYGAAFLKENVRLAWELRGTPWAYPAEKTAILVNFVLEGWQWMARGIHTVPGTIDRSVSRSNALHNADIRDILPMLNELDPSKAETFSAINNQQNDKGSWLQGFRYFPMSDFTAYHQPGFSFFLKTISARTLPAESINSENLKGHLMNSGDAYIIQNGQEYYNLMPVWNWDYLPGITNVAGGEKIFRLPGVGGVTDGKSGVTIMDYVMVNKAGAQILSAKKFWACNRNMVVCLIAGLQSDSTAFTVLDQSRKLSEVITHKTGAATSWIHHNKTAYIFLQPSVVDLQVRQVTGNWRSFNLSQSATPVTETVFMPVWKHVSQQAGGYIIAHVDHPKQVKRLINKPAWKMLSNTDTCQAVQFNDGNTMIAFWKAGTIEIAKDKKLKVNNPCLIQLSGNAIYATDPTYSGMYVTITLDNMNYALALPGDGTTMRVPL